MLQLKDLLGRSVGERVIGREGKILKDRVAGAHGSQGTEESCQLTKAL